MNSEQHLMQQERKGQEWMPKLQWENKQNWEDKNKQAKASGKDYKKKQHKIMSSFFEPLISDDKKALQPLPNREDLKS